MLGSKDWSGQIRDCAVLYASDDETASSNCPQQPAILDEQITGILSALPGCNTPSAGPASVLPGTCPAATFHANTSPGSVSDGQTREVPIINVTVVHGALYSGCYQEAPGKTALTDALLTNSTGMSTALCADFCVGKGFGVFGTESVSGKIALITVDEQAANKTSQNVVAGQRSRQQWRTNPTAIYSAQATGLNTVTAMAIG